MIARALPSRRSAKIALCTLMLALFWALAPGTPPAGEALPVAATARALVDGGTLDVAPYGRLPETVVRDGRRYATTPLGAALALVPAAAVGRAVAALDPGGRIVAAASSGTAALLGALLCALFFAALLDDGLSPRGALFFTLTLALATPIVWYARVADGTILATVLLFAAVRAARRFVAADDRGAALALGLSLGALVLTAPTLLLAALVIVAWCGVHRHAHLRATVAARVATPLALAIAAVVAHHALVGAPPPAAGDVWQGLDGLVLSTGKSLFAYAPIALLAVAAVIWMWRARRADAQLTIAVAAALLLAAARLADWHGDPTWGPRRLVPLLPLAVEAVALAWAARQRAARRSLVALAVAAGLVVQVGGVAIAPTTWLDVMTEIRVKSGAPAWFALEPDEVRFIPQYSPIVGHAWLLEHMVTRNRRFDVHPPYLLLLADPPKIAEIWPRLQLDWFARGWPPRVAAGWLALLGVVAVASALRLRRVLR